MSTMKDELHQLVESLSEEDLHQVHDFVKVLLEEPDDLTPEEWEEAIKGEEEVRRGEWVRWRDVKRTDV